ncbi:Fumagillin beta-trans-bergamotene synthase [Colletotrichum higginsianum]|uniref:Fumagillin beta-trans-bergamotene synthase n=2 Tax=Colletotrichum higginsianum TaxID=80884 RepID=A0A4T0WG46_9PEZI|nr:Fumagillin beta-trans-bergamotene synthase [Colletotrichum higginsianum]
MAAGIEGSPLLEKPLGASSSGLVKLAPEGMKPFQQAVFHLKTLYLFTKSDIKTVLAPQIIFILSAVLCREPLTAGHGQTALEIARRLPLAVFWIWLHLVVCGISNQRLESSIIEDELNKPWRPLAAKRLTAGQAQRLLLAAVPLAVGVSAALGCGLLPTLSMTTLLWMYNDLDGSSIDIWARNAINTGGIMCFSAGSLAVLSGAALLPRSWAWIAVTGAAIATTVQALDFPDMEGDRARGRKTIPLLYGEKVARGGLAVAVLVWSAACPMFWGLRPVFWVAPVGVGGLMAALTVLRRNEKSDDVVAKLWCLWMSVLYVLPLLTAWEA